MKRMTALILVLMLFNGVADAESTRHPRPFMVWKMKRVGLLVAIPDRPGWYHEFIEAGETDKLVLTSPADYYPQTRMQIAFFPRFRVKKSDLKQAASGSFEQVRKDIGFKSRVDESQLKRVQYGELTGYADVFDVGISGKKYTVKAIFALFPTGQPVHMTIVTPQGQIEHIEHIAKIIWRDLEILPRFKPDKLPGKIE